MYRRNTGNRLIAAVAVAALPSLAAANAFTWTGGDASGYFSAANNWSPVGPPTTGSDLFFDAQNTNGVQPTLDANYSVNSLTFNASAYSYSIGGPSLLNIGSGGLIDNASAAESFTTPIVLSASQTWNIAGSLSLSNTLTGTGTTSLTKTGAGALFFAGGGTLSTLSLQAGSANLSSGAYTLSGTTNNLQVGGGGTLTVSNATLDASAENNADLIDGPSGTGMVVNGSSAIFKSGNLYVGSSNKGTGSLTISSGAHASAGLTVISYRGMGNLSVTSGATFISTSSIMSNYSTGATASVSGAGSIWYAGQSLNFGGSAGAGPILLNVSSGGSVVVTGATAFTNSNTVYSGDIIVNGGTLLTGGLSNINPYDDTMLITDPAGGTALTIGDPIATDSYTYSGHLDGTGSLVKTGASTQIFIGKSEFGGSINVTGGTLNMSFAGASSFQISNGALAVGSNPAGPAFVNAGGIVSGSASYANITLNPGAAYLPGTYNNSFPSLAGNTALIQPAAPGTTSTSVPLTLNADTTIKVNASTDVLTLGSVLIYAGNITRTGPGTLILTANNSLGSFSIQAGNTNISAGSLTLNSLSVTGGQLTVNNGISLTTTGTAALGGATSAVITVSGNKSSLSVAQEFDIGIGSVGLLSLQSNASASALTTFNVDCPAGINISSGAILTTNTAGIATNSTSTTASVLLTDQGSTWLTNNLNLGGTTAVPGGTAVINLMTNTTLNVSAGTYFGSNHATLNISSGTMITGWISSANTSSGASLSSRGILIIDDPAAGDLNTFFGTLSGNAVLAKTGASTQIISGPFPFSGTVNISAGALVFNNPASNNSIYSLNVLGGTANFSGGTYKFNNNGGQCFLQGGILSVTNGLLDASLISITESGLGNPLISITGNGTQLKTSGLLLGTNNPASFNLSQGASAYFTSVTNVGKFGTIWISGGSLTTAGLLSTNTGTGAITLIDPPGGFALTLNGSSGTNTYSGNISGTGSIQKSGASTQILAGTDTFTGAASVTAGTLTFSTRNQFSSLAVTNATARFNGSGNILITPTVSVTGTGVIDITNDAADISAMDLPNINSLVTDGFNIGHWNGSGMTSSTAAADTAHLTAVGVIQNNQSGTALFSATDLFETTIPGAGDVLAKYTYFGDTDLDGKVDGSDYTRIDSGYLTGTTGWFNGDFNYDGVINGSDYTLIDNAFNRQGALLTAEIANSSVPEPATVSVALIAGLGLSRRRRRGFAQSIRL